MPTVSIRYFARAREVAGVEAESLELAEGARIADALAALYARHPRLGEMAEMLRVARNHDFAPGDVPLADGDELALIPPVSGGAPEPFAIESAPFSADAAVERLSDPPEARGALVTFAGTVRRHSRGKAVTHLDYEAYAPMAIAKMREIGREIRDRWAINDVAIVHRVGTLGIGEVAVSIAVSAAHRAEAFEGCRHAIERLKQDVPIWKRETAEDGEQWWGLGP